MRSVNHDVTRRLLCVASLCECAINVKGVWVCVWVMESMSWPCLSYRPGASDPEVTEDQLAARLAGDPDVIVAQQDAGPTQAAPTLAYDQGI